MSLTKEHIEGWRDALKQILDKPHDSLNRKQIDMLCDMGIVG